MRSGGAIDGLGIECSGTASIPFMTPMALEVGSRLGHYDVTALIGEGDMGLQATDAKR